MIQDDYVGEYAEEICFKNQFFSSFFGAGKILPIKRNLTQFTKASAIEKNAIVTDNVKNSNERVGINQTRFHALQINYNLDIGYIYF